MVTVIRKSSAADYIAMVVVFLMATGTIFVFSASANISQELDLQRFYDFQPFQFFTQPFSRLFAVRQIIHYYPLGYVHRLLFQLSQVYSN